MCKETCPCKKAKQGTISLTVEEKDFLVFSLNTRIFSAEDLLLARQISDKIDEAFPIIGE